MTTNSVGFDIFAKDRASRVFDKVGDSAQGVAGRIDGVTARFSRHAAVVSSAAALAGTAMLGFAKSSVDAASDQNEIMSKSSIIFGRNAGEMTAWASGASKNMGLSQRAALGAAASFGDMFQQLGFAGEESARMSKQVVQMSADLGSFNNLGTDDVVERLSAAFRGEYDSLQALIPNINAARVEQEALAQTGKASASQLTAQEKAAATLSIVMQDGSRAQGDFARTSDGAANKAKIAAASFEDLKVQIGEKLMPAWQALLDVSQASIGVVGGVVGALDSVPTPAYAVVAALTAIHLLKGPMGQFSQTVSTTMSDVQLALGYASQAAERAGGGFRGLTAGVSTFTGMAPKAASATNLLKSAGAGLVGLLGGPWGIALTAASVGLGAFFQAQQNAKAAADALTATVDKQTGKFTEASAINLRDALLGDLSPSDQKLVSDLGISFTDLAQSALEGGPKYDAAQAKLRELIAQHMTAEGALDATGQALAGVSSSLENQNEVAQDSALNAEVLAREEKKVGTEAKTAAGSVQDLADKSDELRRQQDAARDAIIKMNQALSDQSDNAIDADAATANYRASVDAAKASVKEHGVSLNLNKEAGRANSAALRTLAEDALASAKANLTTGGSLASVTAQIAGKGGAREEFVRLATQMNGGNRAAAEALATKYGLTATKVSAMSTAMGNVPASVTSKLTFLVAGLAQLRDAARLLSVVAVGPGSAFLSASAALSSYVSGKRAAGGPVERGKTYLVGENGPEIWTAEQSGRILSADTTRQVLSNSGGSPVADGGGFVGTVQLVLDGRVIHEALLRFKRSGGGMDLGLADG